MIGVIGLALEKLVFQRLEDYTVVRWGMMTMTCSRRPRHVRWRRAASSLVAGAAAVYESVARSGYFPAALLPTLPTVGRALVDVLSGRQPCCTTQPARSTACCSAWVSLYRGGLPLGILMARFRPVENFFLPLASALMPIPSLAWVPVFILWFGLGNTTAIVIVFYAATFPDAAQRLVGRARRSIRCGCARPARWAPDERVVVLESDHSRRLAVHHHRLRQAFLRAWIAVVGAELLAASDWGLGWVIFDAKEFLNADVMLASLAVIGVIGFVFERLVFGSLERATVHALGHGASGEGLDGIEDASISKSATSRSLTTRPRAACRACEGASFDIEHSEFLCLVGPSGCGKSTLLNIIAGLLRADRRRDPHRRQGRHTATAWTAASCSRTSRSCSPGARRSAMSRSASK